MVNLCNSMSELRKPILKFFLGFLLLAMVILGVQYVYTDNQFENSFHYGINSIKSYIWANGPKSNATLWQITGHRNNSSISSSSNNTNSSMQTIAKSQAKVTTTIITTAKVTTTIITPATSTVLALLQLCPIVPPKLVGPLAIHFQVPSFEELEKQHPELQPGGWYKPPDCTARHRVAIVVPYRARPEQLRVFLNHMHPMLQRQQLNYGIFIVEPAMPVTFNRGMLMNVGFVEANKLYDWQCFVFHDVDLYPENDKNIYSCPESPRHMTPAVDKFGYRLPYASIFGGGSSFKKEHYQKINGFSNKYFGWGGEDDDLWKRVNNRGLKVIRYPLDIARYKMFKHAHEKSNAVNPQRFSLLNTANQRQASDGLNHMKYKVLKVEKKKLYTWVNIQIDQNEVMRT